MTGQPAPARQTTAPLEALRLSAGKRNARHLARTAADGELLLDPPYQRGAVWTLDQQIALVQSWLRGLPIPAIVLNDRWGAPWREANGDPEGDYWSCIDGQQRIRTAAAWFAGDLAVPASWFPSSDITPGAEQPTEDGPYVTYRGLTEVAQRHIGQDFLLPVVEAQLATVAEEADLYLLLNGGGTPHTGADLDAARAHASGHPGNPGKPGGPAQVVTYTGTRPPGFRWATDEETDAHATLPVIAWVTHGPGEVDLAVPVAGWAPRKRNP